MPDLSNEVRIDVTARLSRHIESKPGYGDITYIASGGSAATFSAATPSGKRAIKVYDPIFLSGPLRDTTRRRLQLQRSLSGHNCPNLVSIYSVEESEGTAFVEMELVDWPQLKSVIGDVPDAMVSALIQNLVDAVMHLEKLGIVHRDIKPENIHVSPDFSRLKLLDFGVVRHIDSQDEDYGAGTDHGSARPFIATAQYSSPEYLFRLDEPSPGLWKGLNLYQVGAVLHDLINKRPIFQDEVDKQNRWLVARAVLASTPSFADADPSRLARQKALASRCLVKDGSVRLQIASWTDFSFEAPANGLSSLQAKLGKSKGSVGAQSLAAAKNRIDYEQTSASKSLCDSIKIELISACNQKIRISMHPEDAEALNSYLFTFALDQTVTLHLKVSVAWNSGLHAETATVFLQSALAVRDRDYSLGTKIAAAVLSIGTSEDVTAMDIANQIASSLSYALDLLEATDDQDTIHGVDVVSIYKTKE